jgi:hypothetical protein
MAFGWAEGIVGGEGYVEEEDTFSIWTVIRTNDGGLPVELIVLCWSCRAVGWGVFLEIEQFL